MVATVVYDFIPTVVVPNPAQLDQLHILLTYMTVPNSEVKSRAAVIVNTARVRPALQQGCQLSGAALDGHHSKLVPAHVLNEQEESFFPLQEQETPTTIM